MFKKDVLKSLSAHDSKRARIHARVANCAKCRKPRLAAHSVGTTLRKRAEAPDKIEVCYDLPKKGIQGAYKRTDKVITHTYGTLKGVLDSVRDVLGTYRENIVIESWMKTLYGNGQLKCNFIYVHGLPQLREYLIIYIRPTAYQNVSWIRAKDIGEGIFRYERYYYTSSLICDICEVLRAQRDMNKSEKWPRYSGIPSKPGRRFGGKYGK